MNSDRFITKGKNGWLDDFMEWALGVSIDFLESHEHYPWSKWNFPSIITNTCTISLRDVLHFRVGVLQQFSLKEVAMWTLILCLVLFVCCMFLLQQCRLELRILPPKMRFPQRTWICTVHICLGCTLCRSWYQRYETVRRQSLLGWVDCRSARYKQALRGGIVTNMEDINCKLCGNTAWVLCNLITWLEITFQTW